MELRRPWQGNPLSIFSLLADGWRMREDVTVSYTECTRRLLMPGARIAYSHLTADTDYAAASYARKWR
jgi:hypothetical protein